MHLRYGRLVFSALLSATMIAAASTVAVAQETREGGTRLTEQQIEALYHARKDSARMHFTPADVDFVTGMIGHHAQALVMSDLAPTHGASPQIQTLAARIINAQQDEIALMQQWLRDRGQPVPEVKIDGLELTVALPASDHEQTGAHAGHDVGHDMGGGQGDHAVHAMMPGMLTQTQLEELDAAYGPEFDRLFLTGMIYHHSGAVSMVHDLFARDGAAQDGAVFKLASDIQVDQLTEIARMEQMLEALGE